MTIRTATMLMTLCGLGSFSPMAARADYVYDYVGSAFNYGMTQGATYLPAAENLVAVTDSATALAANTTYAFGTGVTSVGTFSVGLGTASCTGYACLNAASVTINANGAISAWSLTIYGGTPGSATVTGSSTATTFFTGSPSQTGPQSFGSVPLYDAVVVNNGLAGPDYIEGSTSIGTWSVAPAVPLPASLYLLLSGLGGLGMAARRVGSSG